MHASNITSCEKKNKQHFAHAPRMLICDNKVNHELKGTKLLRLIGILQSTAQLP